MRTKQPFAQAPAATDVTSRSGNRLRRICKTLRRRTANRLTVDGGEVVPIVLKPCNRIVSKAAQLRDNSPLWIADSTRRTPCQDRTDQSGRKRSHQQGNFAAVAAAD